MSSHSMQIQSSPILATLFSALFDQMFDQDQFQEALQNSLNTYEQELFQKKNEFRLQMQPCLWNVSMESVSMTCAICLTNYEEGDSIYVLSCSHTFHSECLDESVNFQHTTCPICRTPLQLNPHYWEEIPNENGHFIRLSYIPLEESHPEASESEDELLEIR